jgi:ZIP family zinc transporter
VAILAATTGGLIGIIGGRVSHKVLCALVSLAAGALLGVTVLHIVPETLEILGAAPSLLSLVAGFLVFTLIGKYVYFLCPACAASASEHETGYLRLGVLLMISMSIHSTVDGLAISAGSAHAAETIGLLILLAVSYHKVPEGLALVSVARLAGYGRVKALLVTVLIEFTTALGAFIGLFFLTGVTKLVTGLTLGFVAGSFIYTVGFALLREMFVHEKSSIFVYVGLGFLSILALGLIVSQAGMHAH